MSTARMVFRDFNTDGIPSSGDHEPDKLEIRQLLTGYETIINAFTANGGLVYGTRAALYADLAHGANSMAWVVGDGTPAYNGIYQKSGASGAGSWSRVADLPYGLIVASDVGAGTPNAIVATSAIPISTTALVLLQVFEANTGSPVTVAFNGGAALTVKTASGGNLPSGGFTAGMAVLGMAAGSEFRLFTDIASSAIQAAAEAAADRAEEAAASMTKATTPQAQEGLNDLAYMTALKTAQHVTARIATSPQAIDKTNNEKVMSPAATDVAIRHALDVLSPDRPTGIAKSSHQEGFLVLAGETATLVDYSGQGYVDSIFLAVTCADVNAWNNGYINVYIDGSSTPDISMTAQLFFQALYAGMNPSAANPNYQNRFFSVTNAYTNSAVACTKLPIPFSTRVKITWTNAAASAYALMNVMVQMQTDVPNIWNKTKRLKMTQMYIPSVTINQEYTLVNAVSPGGGRLLGLYALFDDWVNQSANENPVAWELEGNFRVYFDVATTTWGATKSIASGAVIVDTLGNIQIAQNAGTTGSSQPSWPIAVDATTVDGTVTWKKYNGDPNYAWNASKSVPLGRCIRDKNRNVQRCTTAGTSGSTQPTWSTTTGATTADGAATWTNDGPVYMPANIYATGTEDMFHVGFYGLGLHNWFNGPYDVGVDFISDDPIGSASSTRSFYRYWVTDPQRFESSIAVLWQGGNDWNMAQVSGNPRVWMILYWYADA